MVAISNYYEAEVEARRWVSDKYPKHKEVKFSKIWKDGDTWTIQGVVLLKMGIVSTMRKNFRLQLGAESGEIIGYNND